MSIDWSKPLQTKDGRSARVICSNLVNELFPICCAVMEDGEEHAYTYSVDGRYLKYRSNDLDLVNPVPEPSLLTGFVNVYRDSSGEYIFGELHDTEGECERAVTEGHYHLGVHEVNMPIKKEKHDRPG